MRRTQLPTSLRTGADKPAIVHRIGNWRYGPWRRGSEALRRVFDLRPRPNRRRSSDFTGPNPATANTVQPLIVGGQRGAAVFIRPDVESLGQEIARRARGDVLLRDSIVYLTCLHELGHALGLAHTRDFRDIMYYFGYGGDVVEYFGRYRAQLRSRSDIAAVSGLSDTDVGRIKSIYNR
jgi:hypothetical protein